MIRYEYEPALIEETVFLAARQNAENESALRRSLETAYAIADAHERDAVFRKTCAGWFAKLQLDRAVADLVAEHARIGPRVDLCVVRRSPGQRSQSVELFVNRGTDGGAGARTLVMEMCSDTLVDPGRLASFLRRELLKVADMLDDAFGYTTELPNASPCEKNLIRDRYRVLWDIDVERRLADAGQSSHACEERARRAFDRAFTFHGTAPAGNCFNKLWELTATTHAQLLAWATDPTLLPGWIPSDDAGAPRSGQKCPLCGFPTYDWYPLDENAPALLERIARARPGWAPLDGACRQCVEIYDGITSGSASIVA